jgi:cytochrome c-type biogenesis protein CcmE
MEPGPSVRLWQPAVLRNESSTEGVMTAERKLGIAAIVVAGATGALALLGGLSTWQYYLTVEECQAAGSSLLGKRIRVNGTVAPASLKLSGGRESANFTLMGSGPGLEVVCQGPLPDNLTEGVQVVVEGELQRPGWLRGERVLTRCASKYESRVSSPAQRPLPGDGGSAR